MKASGNTMQTLMSITGKSGYRKSEQLENRDAFFDVQFLSIYVNNYIQIHLNLTNLIKPNLT